MATNVALWRGKPVEDCTREELIACIYWLQRRAEEDRRFAELDRGMEQLFADTKERLRQ